MEKHDKRNINMTTSQAVQIVISMQTLPSQIDYVSPSEKAKLRNAEDFLERLSEVDRKDAYRQITEAVDSYYSPIIEGSDGNFYSASDLDEMF